MSKNLIFDIKRYSINDGPGIRITVFIKGCPLSCKWCHNPESQSPKPQKLYTDTRCIGCGECIPVCPNHSLKMTEDGVRTDYDTCTACGLCADVCPSKAIEISGKPMSVDELMDVIKRETVFFDQSEGGVTFSGGEPLLHHEFLIEILDACGREGIHRTIDTTGMAKTEVLWEVAKRADLFLFDLKVMDADKHKRYCGVENGLIHKNLRTLAATGADIWIRIPLIQGVNADDDNITTTAKFVASLDGPPKQVHLLPFHNIAVKKYEKLGTRCNLSGMAEPTEEELAHIISIFDAHGLEAVVGG
ncbi:radical SAM protein [bacterium F16]|nr:radical SAM protein [bacterium F16]